MLAVQPGGHHGAQEELQATSDKGGVGRVKQNGTLLFRVVYLEPMSIFLKPIRCRGITAREGGGGEGKKSTGTEAKRLR